MILLRSTECLPAPYTGHSQKTLSPIPGCARNLSHMSYPNPPGPQPDPNNSNQVPNPIPTGSWYGVPGPGQAPKNPPRAPKPPQQNVRKLNRATAVAVSLSMVGVLGLGTGIALASTVNANSQVPNTSQFGGPNTGQGQPIPQQPGGDFDDDDSSSDTSPYSDSLPERSNSAPNGGFQVGPPAGGTHGNSGAS